MKGIPKEVEINLSRLAYQWESVNHAIDAMRNQAVRYIHEELPYNDRSSSLRKPWTDR